MSEFQVEHSKAYKKFTLFDWNRPINEGLLTRLKESMKKNGYIPSLPIICSPDFEIYDGQHRFLAAESLKLKFSYLIDEDFDIEQVWQSNKDRVSWQVKDYVHYFAARGNLNYKKLKTLQYETSYSYKLIYTIMFGKPNNYMTVIKSGQFQYPEGDEWETKFRQFKELLSWTAETNKHEALRVAIVQMIYHPKYEHDIMLSKLEYQSRKIVKCTTQEEYTALLKEIYNYRNSYPI